MENLFFAAGKMMINGRFRNTQRVDDIGKGGPAVAVPGKNDPGGIEDAVFIEICGQDFTLTI